MKISEYFKLGKSQRELDFVDIDLLTDLPLFIDPFFLSRRKDNWSFEANATIQSFFQHIIDLVKSKKNKEAKHLFNFLHEPKETHLGLSKGKPTGKGIGATDTSKIFNSILRSNAIQSGLVEDLQDSAIFVENIGKDKLSDMTTNIIRKHLIEYTQSQCLLWNIPLTPNVQSDFFWDKKNLSWENELTEMLIINNKPILLVPKAVVSFKFSYTPEKYHQHFVLNFLQNEHLRLDTSLVQRFKTKKGVIKRFVTKKSLSESVAPLNREFLRNFTKKHPQIFQNFKNVTGQNVSSISLDDFENFNSDKFVDFLIEALNKITPGTNTASAYHNFITGALDFLFYPNLICPRKETPIHGGRKRIDITFDNASEKGFFFNLHSVKQIPSQYIFVECKNYSSDPSNPELDQLSSRFSPNKGKFGLLLCRTLLKEDEFLQRCADTYHDHRGLIIPLTDNDLIQCLNEFKKGNKHFIEKILTDKMQKVILR